MFPKKEIAFLQLWKWNCSRVRPIPCIPSIRYIRYRFANHQKKNSRPKSADVEIKKITSIDSHFRWVIEKFKYEISPSENFYNWGLPSSWAQPVFLSPAWNANRDETSAAKNLQKNVFQASLLPKKSSWRWSQSNSFFILIENCNFWPNVRSITFKPRRNDFSDSSRLGVNPTHL